MKQIFPHEPHRLKVHTDALYIPKPPAADGFDKPPASYQIPHRMSFNTEELTRTAAIYGSLAVSMVAWVIEELSPKGQRTKLLREKLAITQSAAATAGSSAQELRFSTASPESGGDGTLRGSSCRGS